jgi:CheY-specific phosphatase CheX
MRETAARALEAHLDGPLAIAAAQAFEELGYFFVEHLDADAPALRDGAAAAVEFSGPMRGTLVLSVGEGILPSLAANMLGADVAPDDAMQLDALGELANVICGSVLPALGGPRAIFALAAPRVARGALRVGDAARVAVARLDLDGASADVQWDVA